MQAFIFSHISYCITYWGQASESAIRTLESLSKQAIEILD